MLDASFLPKFWPVLWLTLLCAANLAQSWRTVQPMYVPKLHLGQVYLYTTPERNCFGRKEFLNLKKEP